jgi:hypothetical protein
MKSPVYILAVLLPLATELALATPVAESNFDALEERGKGKEKDWQDWGNHHGWDGKDPCEVKRTYPYYKYPCSSSPSNGTSLLGAIFKSYCKYE